MSKYEPVRLTKAIDVSLSSVYIGPGEYIQLHFPSSPDLPFTMATLEIKVDENGHAILSYDDDKLISNARRFRVFTDDMPQPHGD